MISNWFLSRTARNAVALCKHIRKILDHQRDILPANGIEEIENALRETRRMISSRADKTALEAQMESLEKTANKWIKPYPNAAWRENIEVLLVALTIAMGVRTFFIQPFKIPTGSMQPTLYGVTSEPDFSRVTTQEQADEQAKLEKDLVIPTGWERIKNWFHGTSYVHVVAKEDGQLEGIEPPVHFLIFGIYQRIHFADKVYTIWFPPDYGAPPAGTLAMRAGLRAGQFFRKGDDIVKIAVNAGDHLFVDRLTYNFRPPERGEIVVFKTQGIKNLGEDQQGTFYIKRLVGLGGETLKLHHDYDVTGVPVLRGTATIPVGNLVVDGKPITASTPHFKDVYSFYGAKPDSLQIPYVENHYYGHAMVKALSEGEEFYVETNQFFVMGDNTMNSSDSRYWGSFPQKLVVGKELFVYWPITKRFGF
ncbi:MAG TPA: S26 family signal peptidase [Verrucomicrobiae bacterium]|nr:S26 family signal peptidase [Verrucomicrobiae bacterium]